MVSADEASKAVVTGRTISRWVRPRQFTIHKEVSTTAERGCLQEQFDTSNPEAGCLRIWTYTKDGDV